MKRIVLAMAVFLGAAVQAVPAAADVTYTLNCSDISCSPSGNYGSVTLHQLGSGSTSSVEVTVNLVTVMNNFAGTGAGFAVNWNIAGNPSLTTHIDAHDAANDPLPPQTIYDTTHFAIQDNTQSGFTYKASPFGSDWMYAIDYTVSGGKASNDNYLIFDVTRSGGLVISDFVNNASGFIFAADIFGGPCSPTCVVAAKVPEPATWLMFFIGLAGVTWLVQRRRQMVRA